MCSINIDIFKVHYVEFIWLQPTECPSLKPSVSKHVLEWKVAIRGL